MDLLNSFPIFLLDDELGDDTAAGRATRALVDHLRADGKDVITATDPDDAEQIIVSGRVEEARREYLEPLLPPFFGAFVQFVQDARYSWHTPGHSGGTAFLKTPVGSAFHKFFGENTLRSDLSVSVAELGSLLEHSGPVGAAEAEAANTFGSDRTMFVTNGTSTANKIVFHACVRPGDVVLVDRNCHKSIMHAIVMTGAIPLYLGFETEIHGIHIDRVGTYLVPCLAI